MVARVLFPWLPSWRNTIPSPPAGDHQGNKCRTQPLILHPRPYGSPGLLPDSPTEGDAYEGRSIGTYSGWRTHIVDGRVILFMFIIAPLHLAPVRIRWGG